MQREITCILHKLSEIRKRRYIPYFIYAANITLTSTLDKDIMRKENYWSIPLTDAKTLSKILAN